MGNGIFDVTDVKWTPYDGIFNTTIMNALSRAVALVPDLEEWEFFLEDWKTGDAEHDPHYLLQLTSSKGKGTSCAVEKMDTLIRHPEIGNTGELRKMELPEGEVGWYGGIQLPYHGYEPSADKLSVIAVTGVIRVAFSGAREAVDLGIVLDVLWAYITACAKVLGGYCYIYDWERLKKDQLCYYLMMQKGFKV